MKTISIVLFVLFILFALPACSQAPTQSSDGENERLKVVATTTILGDVVRNVGGDTIDLFVLLPIGVDPHSFQPAPQDIAMVADADVVFMNGAGLEEFIWELLENANNSSSLVSISDEIDLLETSAGNEPLGDNGVNEEKGEPKESGDPHVWTDPNNVVIWVDHIQAALTDSDAENAAIYRTNALKYKDKLLELDKWINEKVAQIPQANREFVSDHQVFAYFADHYGLLQIGTLIPGYSTLSEPSAQELAALEKVIRDQGVVAIFVGVTANPALARRVADDMGIQLVSLYTGSLTDESGPASTYLDYMRYNVSAIVDALK